MLSLVGVRTGTAPEVVEQIEAGLGYSAVENLHAAMQLPVEEIASLARISPRTLARRKISGKLNLDESERIFRLASVFEKAIQLFEGDRDAARRWLQTSRAAFGGQSALQFAETDIGAREVEDMIERIEYGVIS